MVLRPIDGQEDSVLNQSHQVPEGDRNFTPLARLPVWLRDTILVVFVLGPSLAAHDLGGGATSSVWAALLVLVSAGSVLLRQRAPLIGASVAVVACVLGVAIDGPIVTHLLAVLIGVFGVARWLGRRTSLLFSGATVILLSATTVAFLDTPWNDIRTLLQLAAFVGFATAAGDANRSHAAYIRSITDRARHAEETKESEALRRVAEERLRIARDLHDLLAHQIAVINLHSSVASQALPDRPDDAQKSLATIREAARGVLGEIGSLLNVLRAPDAGGPGTAPVAGLAGLDALLTDFERSGLSVEHRVVGTPRTLPGAVDMVAFRVVQEALTNAHKHGADHSALLHLDYQAAGVEIAVTNTVAMTGRAGSAGAASRTPVGSGHGLLGARERVGSVAGRLTAARGPGPVFRFTAWLPTGGDTAADPNSATDPAAAGPRTNGAS